MKVHRNYKEMTPEEKKRSIELWNKFYNSQLQDDFMASWRYWVERLDYLQQIGVDASDRGRHKWIENIEKIK